MVVSSDHRNECRAPRRPCCQRVVFGRGRVGGRSRRLGAGSWNWWLRVGRCGLRVWRWVSSRSAGQRWKNERSAGAGWHGARRAPLEPLAVCQISPRFLNEDERVKIADLASRGLGPTAIGRELGRAGSTISRELRRNLHHSGQYRPFHAHNRHLSLPTTNSNSARVLHDLHRPLPASSDRGLALLWMPPAPGSGARTACCTRSPEVDRPPGPHPTRPGEGRGADQRPPATDPRRPRPSRAVQRTANASSPRDCDDSWKPRRRIGLIFEGCRQLPVSSTFAVAVGSRVDELVCVQTQHMWGSRLASIGSD